MVTDKMEQSQIEATWGQMKDLTEEYKFLRREFYDTHEPNEKGDYEFDEAYFNRFNDLASRYNPKSFSLMREAIGRRVGDEFDAVYPASGQDVPFCKELGGNWCFVDKAYNNQIDVFRDCRPSIAFIRNIFGMDVFKAEAVTYNFISDELPEEIESRYFDLGLIRHPRGIDNNLVKNTGYEPPEELGDSEWYLDWWDGLLTVSVDLLREGGVLLSESKLEDVREEDPQVRDVLDSRLRNLDKERDLLGIGVDNIPMLEYRQRMRSAEPRSPGYALYVKQVA